MREFTMDEVKAIKDKLKECKPEWLEKNQKGQNSLGVLTVQQILDYATGGLWDFIIEEQWREDVQKYNKNNGQYSFDGYVYHVRGYLVIQGMGRRSQYGSKVAIGGKDNQNSSYKSAASDCLKKCASLFGVGSSIYSKIKIDTDELEYNQIANDPNYVIGQQQQTQQADVAYINNEGLHQQGEYIWYNNAWIHQNDYHAQKQQQPSQTMNGGQYPSAGLTQEQEKTQWYYDTMKEHDPKGYEQMRQQAGPSPLEQIQEVDKAIANGEVTFPFNQAPATQEPLVIQQEFEAQPKPEAVPQAEAQTQNFQAVEYGVPVETPPAPVAPELKKEVDPLAHIEANNPWNNPDNLANLEVFRQHKERLGIHKDADLLPHIREFFQSEDVGTNAITPEVLAGFNSHLENKVV